MPYDRARASVIRPGSPWSLLSRLCLGLVLLSTLLLRDTGEAGAVQQAPFAGRWIDVNLSALTATAYNGSTAVYTALVTAGKKGFATPTGTFTIYNQVRMTDMQSAPDSTDPYYVKDVEYVQYFKSGGFAIHANYWQPTSVFGHSFTSHGCVSMTTKNALYFWNFADIGTPVYIHYGAFVPMVKIPAVAGKTQATAKSQLQAAGFKVVTSNRGTADTAPDVVVSQKPTSGLNATKGSTVTIYVAVPLYRAPVGDTSWAPFLVGLTEAAAVERIELAGLRATYINYVQESDLPVSERAAFRAAPPGTVISALTAPEVTLPRDTDYMIVVKRSS
jgi:L,D-transpeptidase catalytic domain/PASTA domain